MELEDDNVGDLVTICISHYNRLSKLKETISKVYQNTPSLFKIRIFNDGFIDENISEYLTRLDQREEVTVIRSEENVGPVASRFHLLKNIETRFTLTLDDDMYVDEGWLEDAIKIFNNNSNVGFIGFPFKSTTSEDVANTRTINIQNGVLTASERKIPINDAHSEYISVDEVATGAMMIRSSALQDFQFDQEYKIGFGDIDKTLQILESDWDQVIITNHLFTHDKKSHDSEYDKGGNHEAIAQSYIYFTNKWHLRYPIKDHIMYKYIYRVYPKLLRLTNNYQNY